LGPVRQVGAPGEGFSCIDDVARVALVYLDRFEKTQDPGMAERASEAVRFCLNLQDGQGHFFNFVEHDGAINREGATSKPGLNWWTARAFWALSRAERVLPDADLKGQIHGALEKTMEQLELERSKAEVPPELQAAYAETGVKPGTLVDHSGSITSIFALGLIERLKADPSAARERSLLESYGDAMVHLERPTDQPLLGSLHINSLWDPTTVHLYGNRQVQALADGGKLLDRPDWVASARREADRAYPRMLTSYLIPFAFSPSPEPNPQIAYAAEAVVSNLQAVYRATGEQKFSLLAGLCGTWFNGANAAGLPVYNPASGRSFDGIDPKGVSTNSGAESNVETQIAMSALAGTPGEALLGLAKTESRDTDQLLSEDSFQVKAGAPGHEPRTLNGGAVRQLWTLATGDRLAVGPGLLTWKSPSGTPLLVDPDGSGPLPAYKVFPSDANWQVTPLPAGPVEVLGSKVLIDSVVQRPAEASRTWSDGTRTVSLSVSAQDDSWKLMG
jgi:hypothetical protein